MGPAPERIQFCAKKAAFGSSLPGLPWLVGGYGTSPSLVERSVG